MTPIPDKLAAKLKQEREHERQRGYNEGLAFAEKNGYKAVGEVLSHEEREDQMRALGEYGVTEESKAYIEGFLMR